MKTTMKMLLAMAVLLGGCGGKVLYAGRLTPEQVEPAAQLWRDLGATVDIVYGVPPGVGDDAIRLDRWLPGSTPDAEICGTTERPNPLANRDIELSTECIGAYVSLHDDLAHEIGHWIGLHHQPDLGIMAPNGYGSNEDGSHNTADNPLSCADVRNYCTSNECNARAYCEGQR